MLWNTQSCLFLGRELISCKLSEWCVWLFHTCGTRKRVPLSSPGHPATEQWLCSQLCCEIAANQRTLFEIELVATKGWKWGCQPFSCRCSQNVTHWQKEICSTSLSKESLPAIHFGYSKHPLPARRRFLRATVRSTCFAWLHHADPSVAATEKECVPCKEAECLVTELWPPRFVAMQWLCSQLCYVTAANHWTIVEIELLATVGCKWGCRPFSCRCSQNVTDWQKEICSTSLSKESIPTIPFGYSKHPLPARRRFLRAAARSTCFALWFCSCRKSLSYAQKQRVWSRSYGFKICYPCLLWNLYEPPLPTRTESGSALHLLCIMVASCPSLRCRCRK